MNFFSNFVHLTAVEIDVHSRHLHRDTTWVDLNTSGREDVRMARGVENHRVGVTRDGTRVGRERRRPCRDVETNGRNVHVDMRSRVMMDDMRCWGVVVNVDGGGAAVVSHGRSTRVAVRSSGS
jgi:hypothetical protein